MAKVEPERQSVGRPWDRRGLVLAVGLVGLVVAVVAYAGPSWAAVVYQLLIDGMFLVPWLLAAAGWGVLVLELGSGTFWYKRTTDLDTPSPLPSPGGRGGKGAVPPRALRCRAISSLSLRERAGVRACAERRCAGRAATGVRFSSPARWRVLRAA